MSVFTRSGGATLAALLVLLIPAVSRAQSKDNPPAPPAAAAPATAPTPVAPAPAPAPGDAPLTPAPSADARAITDPNAAAAIAELRQELAEERQAREEDRAAHAELQKKVDATSAIVDDADWASKFKIYGFTDVGVQRIWVKDKGPFATTGSGNATSFVLGNLDMYFDARPHRDWRSLIEVRLTNAPHGEIESFGGLAGTFKRKSTIQSDPGSASLGAIQFGAGIILERAYLEWTNLPFLKVRVGNFFTPFGIWNQDHGSPTLIGLQVPTMITIRSFPVRQTGINLYGNTFAGEWELGYHATLTNGRQELSNFAFDDNRGLGARLYANNETGGRTVKLGASFYTGRTRDEQVDVTALTPLTFTKKSTFDYREVIGGLDVSLDIGRTRFRAEGLVRSVQYDDGKHEVAQAASATRQYLANGVFWNGYVVLAHTLPWVPVEIYASSEAMIGAPFGVGDSALGPGIGFNVRFTKSVIWKNQALESLVFDTRGRTPRSELDGYTSQLLFSRLVLVF